MKFYIDTADIEEIREANARGLVDGVTTNPSLVAKTGKSNKEVIAEICKEVSGLVSAEVISTDLDGMVKEGVELAKIADNVVVKIPMCDQGLVAVRRLASDGIKTNVTLIFSPLQALLVAKAGATLCSPFVGRLDDIANDGMGLINQITQIYSTYNYDTEVLVASVRHPMHVLDSALMGADIVTCPYKVMQQMIDHPLTEKGIQKFLADAAQIPNG